MTSLAGQMAIVTGGTGALGQAVVLRLLAAGAAVAVPYRGHQEADALRGRAGPGDRGRLLLAESDMTDEKAMTAFVDAARSAGGRIDILVCAVGGFAGGALVDTDRAVWDGMLAVNLTSAFVAARAVVPVMLAGGRGRIVVVASRAVVPPRPGFLAYTVAKSGVIALTQALAEEVRGRGVTVNAVLPGTMDTPANRRAMPSADRSTWVPVDAVADAIAFLVTDAAGHVTGTLVHI